jgi:hypothetical protein
MKHHLSQTQKLQDGSCLWVHGIDTESHKIHIKQMRHENENYKLKFLQQSYPRILTINNSFASGLT